MTTSRATLRQNIAKAMQEYISGTMITGCTTTTILSSDLIDTGESEERYKGNWLYYRPDPYEVIAPITRRIDAYEPATGAITITRPVTSAPVAGQTFEIHSLLSPDDLNTCINEALARCTYVQERQITLVSGQRQYDISGLGYLTNPEQVVDVILRTGSTASQYTFTPVRPFRVRQAALGTLTLDVPTSIGGYVSPAVLFYKTVEQYTPLTSDAVVTYCPADWLEAGALMFAWKLLAEKGPATDTERYSKKQMQAAQVFWEHTRVQAPRDRAPIMSERNL
jgi:hypothetical protein